MSATLHADRLPSTIKDEDALEELLSRPTAWLPALLEKTPGDIMVLGVGGKVGPTLARMAKRAAPEKRVIGVARFSEPGLRERLESWGIDAISCDLLDRDSVAALPDVPNIVYMAGKKFGTDEDPSFSWAMNTHVPALVAERFRSSRIVAFSTLCVYPFAPIVGGGWDETVEPGPTGDYATSCAGRERIFSFFSRRHGTPGRLIRLNYAIDMRYGVLHDIATWVRDGTPIPITTAYASVIWQGDSNAQILGALAHCTTPTTPLNVGGPEHMSVRLVANEFGRRLGRDPVFSGEEAQTGWYNTTLAAQRLYGYPTVSLAQMIDWVADWIARDMPSHHKPTHYEERAGQF
ncbi:epimerase [Methylobacterium indicum]|uniref:NAD-dependent epimerase/dehydratase family protein n=1 Tax=Methylobacterium indicum TaxID=1775910 RepID=UPI000734F418|nr:NAD(P)-dependent oxidoreductase [Methylobacterium indicum]KTS25439.1 epimerase [Methylobacterium indicum]KTS34155.1 epimerase [Methylobacterium indicum]KTS53185.1 epimerase [Methylobacterium indicum]